MSDSESKIDSGAPDEFLCFMMAMGGGMVATSGWGLFWALCCQVPGEFALFTSFGAFLGVGAAPLVVTSYYDRLRRAENKLAAAQNGYMILSNVTALLCGTAILMIITVYAGIAEGMQWHYNHPGSPLSGGLAGTVLTGVVLLAEVLGGWLLLRYLLPSKKHPIPVDPDFDDGVVGSNRHPGVSRLVTILAWPLVLLSFHAYTQRAPAAWLRPEPGYIEALRGEKPDRVVSGIITKAARITKEETFGQAFGGTTSEVVSGTAFMIKNSAGEEAALEFWHDAYPKCALAEPGDSIAILWRYDTNFLEERLVSLHVYPRSRSETKP